jgi:hypothetical protein
VIPTLPSPRLDWEGYAHCVYRSTVDAVRRLPVQWRGFVLRNLNLGHTVEEMHRQIERGAVSGVYDPQGAFDAFQGQSPQ